jgi:hypothetical protein
MATTTPNYGWDVPTSTDYVKDGATAIETLGDDIDATLYTALGGAYPGLRLIKKQTIGTGVSSVVVNDAFSTTYDNYQILLAGGAGSTNSIDISLNVGGTTTSYYANAIYALFSGTTVSAANTNNGNTFQYAGSASTAGIWGCFDILSPFLATNTVFSSRTPQVRTNGSSLFNSGWHGTAASYTSFTLTPIGGTLTGGTIYVYGYGKS